ncbi:hypothetical protein CFOLD11_40900 [Clostridium folliculivorans]|uniref:Uncharacterized protein n=1 Tax=Clostridium folliculivorans TaxID=2886038 RepID=A0A9W5Y699_9CLOT|nr:hypothetical protein [Clostridium folliculivorans]GKU27263.1 hypothetical protein CFOLD11_40900 [Clostridium folliculivorans]
MNNFEQYKMALYKREIIKNGDRIESLTKANEMLSLENERLNAENIRIKEQLEILKLKNHGFVGRDRRVGTIGILCDNDNYENQGILN